MKKRYLFLLINLHQSISVFAQVDSLKVYFWGEGPKGERFLIYADGQKKIDFKSKGKFIYSFNIAFDSTWKDGNPLGISFYRRGRFSLWKQNIDPNIAFYRQEYKVGNRVLVIDRDQRLKNKYCLRYNWRKEPPKFPD
jgi:hypothetical protein